MIRPTPEDYGFVQIDRPILDGESFLSQVRTIGQLVLGGERVASISELALTDESDSEFANEDLEYTQPELVHQVVPTIEPLVSVSQKNDFSLVMLHRAAPKHLSSRFSFGHAQGRLAADHITVHKKIENEDGTYRRAKTQIPSLTSKLDAIVESAGDDPEWFQVVFDRVDIVGETGRDFILGLSPRNSDPQYLSLIRQSKESAARLMIVSKKLAAAVTPWIVSAPFARIPSDISDRDYGILMTKLDEILPVRLTLGSVGYSSKDRRSER
jgi:hypothetical protein